MRLLIRDVTDSAPLLQDEEIAFLLTTTNGSIFAAAALACETLAARFSQQAADKQVGDLRISFTNKANDYLTLAKQYSDRAGSSGLAAVTPYAGGLTYTDKSIDEDDLDIVPPAFKIGQFETPQTNDRRVK